MKKELVQNIITWLRSASEDDVVALRGLSDTTRNLVYQWTMAIRNISPRKAGQLADAMKRIKEQNPLAPEPLLRGDLCTLCNQCPHFIAAKEALCSKKDTENEPTEIAN